MTDRLEEIEARLEKDGWPQMTEPATVHHLLALLKAERKRREAAEKALVMAETALSDSLCYDDWKIAVKQAREALAAYRQEYLDG